MIKVSGGPECQDGGSDNLRVQIWPTDGYRGHIQETRTVPLKIGDKDGLYDEPAHEAAVQVQPGMLVVFGLGGRSGVPVLPPTANFKDILANVAWPADPRNEETWPPVSEWAK